MMKNRSISHRCVSLISILVLLAMVFTLTGSANAAPPWLLKTHVGEPIGGKNLIVAVDENEQYAYVAQGSQLIALDIYSEPGQVSGYFMSQPLQGQIHDIVLQGNYAYLAAGTAGMVIMDITNPTTMRMVSQWDVSYPIAVAISGNTVYLVTDQGAIIAVNVSNVAQPGIIGAVNGNAIDVTVFGTSLFVAAGSDDLLIYNISVPGTLANPVQENLPNGASFRSISVAKKTSQPYDTYALLGGADNMIAYVDVTNPANPVMKKNYSYAISPLGIYDVFLTSSHAFTAEGEYGVCAIRIEDLALENKQAKVCHDQLNVIGNAVTFLDGILYGGYDNGLQIIRVDTAKVTGSYYFDFTGVRSVVDWQDRRYVIDDDRFSIYNPGLGFVSDSYPGLFVKMAPIQTTAKQYVVLSGFQANLTLLDVTDPANIQLVESLPFAGNVLDIQLVGQTLYLILQTAPQQIVALDMEDPTNPMIQDYVDLPDSFIGAELEIVSWITVPGPTAHRRAYITSTGNGLAVIDVSDPANFGAMTQPISGKTFHDIAVLKSKLFGGPLALYLSTGLQVEIYDPQNIGGGPKGTINTAGDHLLIQDGLLFTGGDHLVIVYDLSSPYTPRFNGFTKLPNRVTRLERAGFKQVYASTGPSGAYPITALDRSVFMPSLRK